MKSHVRLTLLIVCLVLPGFVSGLFGCSKEKKEATLEFMDGEFSIRQDTDHSFVIDAKGVVKNIGDVDVKNLVVTAYCRSCGEVLINGRWFVSDIEKMPHQTDTISYLAVGDKESFSFKEVAFYMAQGGNRNPEALPEGLEFVVESYEAVD